MIDPRLKLAYLAGVAAVALATSSPALLLGLLALQGVLWLAARLPARLAFDSVRRLGVFVALVLLSYAFFTAEPGDDIRTILLPGSALPVNVSGLVTGLLLSTRIVTLVLAGALVRHTGPPGDVVRGLEQLRVPPLVGAGLDLVLALMAGPGPHRRGSGRHREGDGGGGRRLPFRRLLRGDVGLLVEAVERSIGRARRLAAGSAVPRPLVNDLAVLAGLAAVGMTVRFVKFLPGLPIAPGHKGLVLIPLYVAANRLSSSRWGATQFGAIMGLASLLLGLSNKLGPLGLLRHLTPGLFVDLVVPPVRRIVTAPPAWIWGVVGAGAALTRVSSVVLAALVVAAPPAFYAMLIPMVVTNLVFGFLSGFVTARLLEAVARPGSSPAGEAGAGSLEAPAAVREGSRR